MSFKQLFGIIISGILGIEFNLVIKGRSFDFDIQKIPIFIKSVNLLLGSASNNHFLGISYFGYERKLN